jgi:hypothetical protein
VIPAIIDPGQYDLAWILNAGESFEELKHNASLTEEDIKQAIANKHYVDQLYLVKWRGLSYSQATWEPESLFKRYFEDKIQDYNRFNRSLDQFQRDRLDLLVKNHKKMLRITEKKVAGNQQAARKQDPAQENSFSLQEAKINRAMLNQKIQEVMGDAYYQVW